MSAHAELIARLEAATGLDQDLDGAIHDALFPARPGVAHDSMGRPTTLPAGWGRGFTDPAYTASVDAALALVERALPGWTVAGISQQDDKSWFAELREGFLTSYTRVATSTYQPGTRPKTPALALCIAVLRALEAQP